ncbi:hypothetical protein [uncultured Amnibacterium sp.]|uniref:hypothetical protein n=1 Tax=uncultured Amnibacterium sp. TaxID=1631851 RepID=UPI0035CC62CE
MSDAAASGPYRVSVLADVWVSDPRRLDGADEPRLADALAGLIRGHAWEAGLEIIDPESVRVRVERSGA